MTTATRTAPDGHRELVATLTPEQQARRTDPFGLDEPSEQVHPLPVPCQLRITPWLSPVTVGERRERLMARLAEERREAERAHHRAVELSHRAQETRAELRALSGLGEDLPLPGVAA